MAPSVFCLIGVDGKVPAGQISTFESKRIPLSGVVLKTDGCFEAEKSGPKIRARKKPG